MRKIRSAFQSTPAFLAGITVITYGFLIPWLSFYWDDWTFAFLSNNYGPGELIRAFAPYRPFLGPIFFVTLSILGTSPIVWQIFGLVLRFVLAFAMWWTLKQMWPTHKKQVLTSVLIFLVFPGYSQQWVALTHINQEIIPLIAYIFSLGLTVCAIQNPVHRTRNVIFSILLQFVGLFSTEYFLGYEFIRLVMIFLLLEPGTFFIRFKQTLKTWLPYAVLWIANCIWLFLYYHSDNYNSYDIQRVNLSYQNPFQIAASLFSETLHTLSTAVISAWTHAFSIFQLPMQSVSFLLTFGLLAASFAFICFYRLRVEAKQESKDNDRWAWQAMLLGLVGILVGRIPSWAAGLPFEVRFDYDRFFLSIMLGASLLTAGMLEYLIKPGKRQIFATSLLIALAISGQFLYANTYRRDTQNQQNLFNQLSWRAPAIKAGTILLTDKITAIPHESDLSLSAPLNQIYAPVISSHILPYILLYTDIRLDTRQLPSIAPNQKVDINYRTTHFAGNTSDMIVFYYPEVGCIKVIDPENQVMMQEDVLPANLIAAARLSNLSRIDSSAAPVTPPVKVSEKENSWCYFYQKADLARQMQDWERIVQLYKEAGAGGYTPEDPLEWLPFVEGYLKSGRLDQAEEILMGAFKPNSVSNSTVCIFLEQMAARPSAQSLLRFVDRNVEKYSCN